MKNYFAFMFLICFIFGQQIGFAKEVLNPTGTYKMKGKRVKVGGSIFGPVSGKIQVKQIAENKIVMTFYVDKGAPSYNSGSFDDTLSYRDGLATYYFKEMGGDCKISFRFSKNSVMVHQTEGSYEECGFGYGVVVDGTFKKSSSKLPQLMHPLTGELIE